MAPEDPAGTDSDYAGLAVREAAAAVAHALSAAGLADDDPARDARLLLQAALALSAEDLIREPSRVVSAEEAEVLRGFVARRAAREPVSRILGMRGFFGRMFQITPATLDPRPCTETVIEAALDIASREGWRGRPIRILDVGTGSGALIVTLLAELEQATGVATDISDAALAVALENADDLGVGSRVEFLNRRSLAGIEGPFDLIVSNPPYIPTGDIAGLDPEVRDYDPLGALDGGADGLDIYRELAEGFARVAPDGWLLVEVGAGQAEAVADIFRRIGGVGAAPEVRQWADLGQHTRCVAVRSQR